MTSDSLTAPTEPWMTLSRTSSVDSRSRDSVSASTEPCTSALSTSRSSLTSPASICLCRSSSVMRAAPLPLRRSRSARTVAICRALRSSATTRSVSPAWGTPERPEDLDRVRRLGLGDLLAAIAEHGADPARVLADDDRVAFLERARLDQHRRHRAAAPIQPAFDDDAAGGTVRVCAQLQHLGLERRHLEQLRDAVAALGGGRDEDRLATPVLGHEAQVRQLALDPVGVAAGLVDLVDRDEDRHVRGLGMVDGLDRLRHHAVVGRHDQDDDVRRLGAAGAHGREGLVARGVEERDLAVGGLHLVGADVLGDAAGLPLRHLGGPDGVEE